SVGRVVEVTESSLDAVTGLSGSGPAYVFLMAEAMTDAGVAVGLTREVAGLLAKQTILGAGRMMMETEAEPIELRAAVTTPAGTTAAGLGALEERGLRAAVAAAVLAATQRSIELGKAE
ncbi:MAG: pyrroline-5-carboxylate reductase dimerization domain-containing protein, partial [Acidimicrobiales bacterium]